jgi:hypothetical protein
MSPMTKLPFNRPVAAIVLLTFCVSVGCSNVRTVGVEQLSPDEAESLVGKNVSGHVPTAHPRPTKPFRYV